MDNNLDTVVKRLEFLIEQVGMTRRQFALKLGMDPSNLSKILRGTIRLSPHVLRNIENEFDVNSNWLNTGHGDMMMNGRTLMKVNQDEGLIPYYDSVPVSAGSLSLARLSEEERPSGYISLPTIENAEFSFPVVGCSMEPLIKAGDIIAVSRLDRFESVEPDKVYLIITQDDRMIKHLVTDENNDDILWCISENKDYAKFRIYKSEVMAIFRVVFFGRLL